MNPQTDTGAQSVTPAKTLPLTGNARTVMDGAQQCGVSGLVLWGMVKNDDGAEVNGGIINPQAFTAGQVLAYADFPEVTDGDTHSYMKGIATGRAEMAVVSYIGETDMQLIADSATELVAKGNLAATDAPDDAQYIPNTVHFVGPDGTVSIAVVDLTNGRAIPVDMDALLADFNPEDYWLSMDYGGNLVLLIETSTESGTFLSIDGVKLAEMVRGERLHLNTMSVRGQVKVDDNEYLLRPGKPGQNSEMVINIVTADGKLKVQTYALDHNVSLRDVKQPTKEFIIDNGAIGVPENFACIGIGALPNTLGFMDESGSYMCVDIDADPILAEVAAIWKVEPTTDDAIDNDGDTEVQVNLKDGGEGNEPVEIDDGNPGDENYGASANDDADDQVYTDDPQDNNLTDPDGDNLDNNDGDGTFDDDSSGQQLDESELTG